MRILERVLRLEQRTFLAPTGVFRYGWIRRLPKDYAGERHVVIVKREPGRSPGIEWCEFEERRGPALSPVDNAFTVYCTGLPGVLPLGG